MKRDTRITLFVAIVTFLGLTLVTGGIWAFTREKAPAAPAAPSAAAAAPTPTEFERISVDELKSLVDRGEVVVIDVRAAEAYVESHIAGALHIPLTHIEGEIEHLPKGKLVVTYCSCPAEETSGQAALILQHFGVEARALAGGYDAWLGRKLATASGVK